MTAECFSSSFSEHVHKEDVWSADSLTLVSSNQFHSFLLRQGDMMFKGALPEGKAKDRPLDAARQVLCDSLVPDVRRRGTEREVARKGSPAEKTVAQVKNPRAGLVVAGAKVRGHFATLFLEGPQRFSSANRPVPSFWSLARTLLTQPHQNHTFAFPYRRLCDARHMDS